MQNNLNLNFPKESFEIFQWEGDVSEGLPGSQEEGKEHLGE